MTEKRVVRIAVIGLGSVGRGVLKTLERMPKQTSYIVTAVSDSKSACIAPDGIDIAAVLAKKESTGVCSDTALSSKDVVETAPYDLLVEVSPTDAESAQPATDYIKTALRRGAHVVTSNKGPIALYYRELMELAKKQNVSLRYEATVAGAIPILHVLEHDLLGNKIQALYGILNGTCNYILTRMSEEGLTYPQALDEARKLGYAEADPRADVLGIDAAIKVAILANTVFEKSISLSDIDTIGIDRVTDDALRLAAGHDSTIRLVGEIIPDQDIYRVSPRILPKNHPLVVEGSLNAITIQTDLAGNLTFIGKGAGSFETTSAIMSDIFYILDILNNTF
jgi:homoserine dehydrogenase